MRIYEAIVHSNGTETIYLKLAEKDRVREYLGDKLVRDLRSGEPGFEALMLARYDDMTETAHIKAFEFEVV